jgi:hypothetical protein
MTEYNPDSIDAVLARIEQRQVDNGSKLDNVIQAHTERFEKVENRIAAVERKVWYSCGFGGAVAVMVKFLFGK